jgi:hypothetical protein
MRHEKDRKSVGVGYGALPFENHAVVSNGGLFHRRPKGWEVHLDVFVKSSDMTQVDEIRVLKRHSFELDQFRKMLCSPRDVSAFFAVE